MKGTYLELLREAVLFEDCDAVLPVSRSSSLHTLPVGLCIGSFVFVESGRGLVAYELTVTLRHTGISFEEVVAVVVRLGRHGANSCALS